MKKIISFILCAVLVVALSAPALAALQKGSKGADVVELQKRLIELGYLEGDADGSFGKMTKAALEAFQTANGLEVTGVATIRDTTVLFSADAVANGGSESSSADDVVLPTASSIGQFHYVEDYETYNQPASVNGLENDLIIIDGTISKRETTETVSWIVITQDDGKEWLISSGYTGDEGIVDDSGYAKLQGKKVKVFCAYLGFSEVWKLPAADIMAYGGILDIEEEEFRCSAVSEILMSDDGIRKSDFLKFLP